MNSCALKPVELDALAPFVRTAGVIHRKFSQLGEARESYRMRRIQHRTESRQAIQQIAEKLAGRPRGRGRRSPLLLLRRFH